MPFVTTLHAKGFLPESHANLAGVIGRARRSDVKTFIDRADLIIAVGYDPIEINYEEWVKEEPIVHISTEAAESGNGSEFPLEQGVRPRCGDRGDGRDCARRERMVTEELHAASSCFGTRAASRPAPNFSAHHVLDILREWLAGRRHSGLRRRRAYASDRQPMAHRFAANFARDQRLVVDGLRHAGGLCRRNLVFPERNGRLRRRRRRFSDDCRRTGAGAATQFGGADDRAQRRLARLDEGEAGAAETIRCPVCAWAIRRNRRPIISACRAAPPKTPDEFRGALEWASRSTARASSKLSSMPRRTRARFSIRLRAFRMSDSSAQRDRIPLDHPRTDFRIAYHRRGGAVRHQHAGAVLQR